MHSLSNFDQFVPMIVIAVLLLAPVLLFFDGKANPNLRKKLYPLLSLPSVWLFELLWSNLFRHQAHALSNPQWTIFPIRYAMQVELILSLLCIVYLLRELRFNVRTAIIIAFILINIFITFGSGLICEMETTGVRF